MADSIFANIDRLFGLDKHFFEKIDAEILFFANAWLMEDKNADDKHICQLVIKFFVCHHNINYVLLLFIVAWHSLLYTLKKVRNKKKYYVISCFWHVVYFNLRVLFLNTLRSWSYRFMRMAIIACSQFSSFLHHKRRALCFRQRIHLYS